MITIVTGAEKPGLGNVIKSQRREQGIVQWREERKAPEESIEFSK